MLCAGSSFSFRALTKHQRDFMKILVRYSTLLDAIVARLNETLVGGATVGARTGAQTHPNANAFILSSKPLKTGLS